MELHYSSKVFEGSIYASNASAQEYPEMKASLLNDVSTTGDLQLVCEVRKFSWLVLQIRFVEGWKEHKHLSCLQCTASAP